MSVISAIWSQIKRAYRWASEAYNAWGLAALAGLAPAGLMAWLWSQVGFLWAALGWFGVASIAFLVWFVAMIGISELERYRYRHARRLFIQQSIRAPETKEDKRERQERRAAISEARSLIAQTTGSIAPMPEFSTLIQASYCFYKLRPRLSEQFRQMLIPNPRVVAVDVSGSPVPGLARAFADEVDRIEREWGLA